MDIRRIVTARTTEGRSVAGRDGPSPCVSRAVHTPGFVSTPLWATAAAPGLEDQPREAATVPSLLPGPGETRFLVVTFPPDRVRDAPGFDPQRAGAEFVAISPGLAETFEADHPGVHTTPTVDYGIVLDGEIWLELDEETVHLRTHDTVVQNGTRHAWRNKSDKPATVAFVLIGATTDRSAPASA
ncbi:MAG: cupin domain-containing protein [Methylobacterium frigidaeris]